MQDNFEIRNSGDRKILKSALLELLSFIEKAENVNDEFLDKFIREKNSEVKSNIRLVSKRRLMPEYLRLKKEGIINPASNVDKKMISLLQAKPRRTASGVATITVLTKPWPCVGDCIFCPSDIRMPKSYLHNEPACQRAEKWNFDPFNQVTSRLFALHDMGHNIDKIELIVLGGTFSNYREDYQIWFIKELFAALNNFDETIPLTEKIQNKNKNIEELKHLQKRINNFELSYNEAWEIAYLKSEVKNHPESCSFEDLQEEQHKNESAKHRAFGLVIETRPDTASLHDLIFLRKLGCTKIQIGIQTLNQSILNRNCRNMNIGDIQTTLKNMRLLGFKSHVHIMANLIGSTPKIDKQTFHQLVHDENYMPDEIKVYPCCLVESAKLKKSYEKGEWQPYSQDDLIDIMISNILETPAHTRISRMIRDISTEDIIAGNKKPNLRQLVENKLLEEKNILFTRDHNNDNSENNDSIYSFVQEMRFREIANDQVNEENLKISDVAYKTSNTEEHFLQFVTLENRLVAFLRLSLPNQSIDFSNLPISANEAMIREVHVYGKVARLHSSSKSAQHIGLGKKLIDHACSIAKQNAFRRINVISAVGTREYYRTLGFEDRDLYQSKNL